METKLRIFISICIVLYFAIIIFLVRKSRVSLKYALVWIVCGIGMIFFTIFPEAVFAASGFIGVSNPVNAVFMLYAIFTLLLLMALTTIVSTLTATNLRLTQKMALLEERLRKLEEK